MSGRGTTASPRTAGALYEDIALAHLQRAGLRLIERNFTCRLGELDLIMQCDATLVFVEVRYRRASAARLNYGDGVDSISASKRTRLLRAAAMFLSTYPRFANSTCRFDVIAISGDPSTPVLDWRINAFEAC